MASINLSTDFDVIKIDLLMKWLRILGLLGDVVSLIEIWFRDSYFFVEINDLKSGFLKSSEAQFKAQSLAQSFTQYM